MLVTSWSQDLSILESFPEACSFTVWPSGVWGSLGTPP